MSKKREPRYYGNVDDYMEDDFIVDDGEPTDPGAAFSELRKMTGYDPSKFRDDDFDDRQMEVGFAACQAEERKSSRLGEFNNRLL